MPHQRPATGLSADRERPFSHQSLCTAYTTKDENGCRGNPFAALRAGSCGCPAGVAQCPNVAHNTRAGTRPAPTILPIFNLDTESTENSLCSLRVLRVSVVLSCQPGFYSPLHNHLDLSTSLGWPLQRYAFMLQYGLLQAPGIRFRVLRVGSKVDDEATLLHRQRNPSVTGVSDGCPWHTMPMAGCRFLFWGR